MKNKLISYDNDAPTAYQTLIVLAAFAFIVGTYVFTYAKEIEYVLEQEGIAEETRIPKEVKIITTSEFEKEEARQEFLADLRECESQGNDHAVGDGGDSIGAYQWQKPTLEAKLGRAVTYDEYYSIVTDYDRIHELTYDTYFKDGESWRWKNCTLKIKGNLTWNQ